MVPCPERAQRKRARARARAPEESRPRFRRERPAAGSCGDLRRVAPSRGRGRGFASAGRKVAAGLPCRICRSYPPGLHPPAARAGKRAVEWPAPALARPPSSGGRPPTRTHPHLPGRAVPLAQPPTKRPTPGRTRGGGVRGLEGRERARQASRAARPDCAGGLRECAGGRPQLVAAARRWGCSFKWSTMRQRQQRPQRPAVALLPRPRLVLPIGGPIAGAALLARSAR